MKLYSYWRSTAAYRVRIALALKGIEYETLSVHLVKGGGEQHSDAYKILNPLELVPTLDDKGCIISQSSAIIEYLEECYPDVELLPKEPYQRAKIRAMAQAVACDIHPVNNLRVLQYLKSEMAQQQDAVDIWYRHWIEKGFAAIETQLEDSSAEYCFSNEITLADVFLIPQVYNANRFNVPLDNFPLISAINKRCLELDSFKAALPEHQPDAV